MAKRAIESLNHDAILFEHIGARSLPPRTLYLGKLDQSDIFISIYRNGYGWVAPGSIISGIEDELRRSSQRGMPRLVYVLDPAQDRDPRLSALLKEVQSEITYSRYRNPEELYERDELRALDTLVRQVTGSVRWDQCVRLLISQGVEAFIEVGPGRVLCGLMRQIDRSKTCLNVGDEASLAKTLEALSQAA